MTSSVNASLHTSSGSTISATTSATLAGNTSNALSGSAAAVTAPTMPVTAPGLPLDADGKPRYSYVVIEGPAGAGKSALAKVLAERWAMTPVFEHPEINPFLERFYRDPARHALAVQSQFLLQRSAHPSALMPSGNAIAPGAVNLAGAGVVSAAGSAALTGSTAGAPAGAPLAGHALIVSDFLPQKDVIYARLNLDPEEFALYQRLAQRLATPLRSPDLVIYLQASPETLFARMQKRSSGIESQISDAYLRALCDAYNQFFYHYTDAPLLTVNAENLEPAENDADLGLLLDHIASMRGPRTFFVKGSL